MRATFHFVALLAVFSLLGACASVSTTEQGAVGIHRKQTMLVSEQSMEQASLTEYQGILKQAKQSAHLNENPAEVARVRGISNRLIAQTGVFRQDALRWPWEVNVITSNELNAWCMAGGKIAVYTGLIEVLHTTDDELAAVIGHEIAHALREHSRERASQAMVTALGTSVISSALGIGQTGNDLLGVVSHVTFELPNSREHESEADIIGIELAARAGYDPRAAISFWKKMQAQNTGQPPQWLSTHPSNESRIEEINAQAGKVMGLYEAAHRAYR